MTVVGDFSARGGITTTVTAHYTAASKRDRAPWPTSNGAIATQLPSTTAQDDPSVFIRFR